jgi:hypothetical protein
VVAAYRVRPLQPFERVPAFGATVDQIADHKEPVFFSVEADSIKRFL